jgi:hypothetical protein
MCSYAWIPLWIRPLYSLKWFFIVIIFQTKTVTNGTHEPLYLVLKGYILDGFTQGVFFYGTRAWTQHLMFATQFSNTRALSLLLLPSLTFLIWQCSFGRVSLSQWFSHFPLLCSWDYRHTPPCPAVAHGVFSEGINFSLFSLFCLLLT